MDEVSLPIVLAWWLGRTSAADWQHVRAAADYVVANGPESPQERWENQDGWSPNTIATEIAGLICAADIARKNGDAARAAQYEATADAWQRSVEDWTATDSTEYYSPAPYYLRLTKDANPNDGSDYNLGDNFPRPVDEREIVDQSFLGLVLFGVKPHDDPTVLNSLEVGDDALKVDTPNGPVWNRFTLDGYGETASGGDWDIFPDRRAPDVRPPVAAPHRRARRVRAARRPRCDSAPRHDRAHRERRPDAPRAGLGRPPADGPPGLHEFGEGTRSATPLAWTHAQLIRLAWSIDAGAPIERPSIVACRYAVGCGSRARTRRAAPAGRATPRCAWGTTAPRGTAGRS